MYATIIPSRAGKRETIQSRSLVISRVKRRIASVDGSWSFGTGNEYFVGINGNPGSYLRDSSLVTFTPRASTAFGVPSEFHGDYAARGVASVGEQTEL